MHEEQYCYDGQLQSIEFLLDKQIELLEEIVNLLRPSWKPGKNDVYCPTGEYKEDLSPSSMVKIEEEDD